MATKLWIAAVLVAAAACNDSTPPRNNEVPFEDLELRLELAAEGLNQAIFLTAPEGDARLFVVEKEGRVRVVKGGTLLPTPFLDISSRVGTVYSRGLLSIVFDPEYASNGKFYAYYIDKSDNVVVERFNSTPGADVAGASGGVVITFHHGGQDLHGGSLEFGPDGMLYFASGDGGCCDDVPNNAQNMGVLLGKMVRIDVRTQPYTVPSNNPFVGQAGVRPEIWASGLRNPWRFTFDKPSGFLYIADVGERVYEEIDIVRSTDAGLNFGWRLMEGLGCFNPSTNCKAGANLTEPVHAYTHPDGCAIIGGFVYRGDEIPALQGHYLYSDYCDGWLRSLRWTGSGTTDHRQWEGISVPFVQSFGRDGAGELYMIEVDKVWKIVQQ
jgi:glucose/arabinose dehydrogenase